MLKPTPSKSRSVLGATELTLMSPLRRGLINAPLARSFETRAATVLATLQALGVARREIDLTPGITEVADTLRSIRSFRFAILGQETRHVLLSVSFDGGWEPYLRRVWRDLGTILDLIFCNCEDHLNSRTHSYPDYIAYVRRIQVQTEFFFEGTPLKVMDQQPGIQAGMPPAANASGAPSPSLFDQGRRGLVALYRLTELYPAQSPEDDHETLLSAARALLGELKGEIGKGIGQLSGGQHTPTEAAAWAWFCQKPAAGPPATPDVPVDLGNVQGGILDAYPSLAHGCLALVGLEDVDGVIALIDHVQGLFRTPAIQRSVHVNLAFTCAGLQLAGLDADTLGQLPQEFREGMEARSSVLGDWLYNHPSKWTLPEAYGNSGPRRVALTRVHAVVQFGLPGAVSGQWADLNGQAKQDLRMAVEALDASLDAHGSVLSVQAMQRYADESVKRPLRGHFDFNDGLSQPGLAVSTPPPAAARDCVQPGDLLLGYPNSAGDPGLQGPLWKDSCFLVIRKLRMFPERLQDQVPDVADREMLMGRRVDGRNLIDPTKGNDFDYTRDAHGTACPLHSHVRRGNPREAAALRTPLPRILRRGMSYGPLFDWRENAKNDDQERGVVFMAYNASIAEQFEVIQGWMSGANSASPGLHAGLRDPFLGVPQPGDPRRYTWTTSSGTRSIDLPTDQPLVTLQWGMYTFVPSLAALNELRARAVQLRDEDVARDPGNTLRDGFARQRVEDQRRREEATLAARGSALIARLRQAEQALGLDAARESWKAAAEDEGARRAGLSPALWAAIRKVHGGVLRTPLGVLVATKTLVMDVFNNAQGNYSATGYNTRLKSAFGEIYLGLDEGPAYRAEADPVNQAIMAVSRQEAFELARGVTKEVIETLAPSTGPSDIAVEFRDLVDGLLAAVCPQWFGLPDKEFVLAGGLHRIPNQPASCPAHFHATSLSTFQPRPSASALKEGEDHGQLLRAQVLAFVLAAQVDPALPRGVIGGAIFDAFAKHPSSPERITASLIGAMMGLLPTVDGSLRGVLYEWVRDRSLWDLQAGVVQGPPPPTLALAHAEAVLLAPLQRSLQERPVPEVVWRTALNTHTLGLGPQAVQIRAGDTVVASIVSAMQEDRLEDLTDPFLAFGGDRRASSPPQHACPGYEMAMGLMLGFLYALLRDQRLRPAISPVTLRFVR